VGISLLFLVIFRSQRKRKYILHYVIERNLDLNAEQGGVIRLKESITTNAMRY